MRADIERWNRKYQDVHPTCDDAPDPLLIQYGNLLDGAGRALDVACGMGRNAIYLAGLGYRVLGVDGSIVGLQRARRAVRAAGVSVDLVAADLDRFTVPPDYFDLVLVVKFLSRSLIPALKQTLKAGGLFIYNTFNLNLLQERPGFNAHFLLEPGELAALFEDFDTIDSNDSPSIEKSLSYWIGRKPMVHG